MPETTDRIVAFVYLLLRDKLVAGDVEALVDASTTELAPGPVRLANEHLAALAADLVERLREASGTPRTLDAFESLERYAEEVSRYTEVAEAFPPARLREVLTAALAEVQAREHRVVSDDGAQVAELLIAALNRAGLMFSTAYRLELMELGRRIFYAPAEE